MLVQCRAHERWLVARAGYGELQLTVRKMLVAFADLDRPTSLRPEALPQPRPSNPAEALVDWLQVGS